MPIYAKDVYGGGPGTLGSLLASAGAGALSAMLYLASRETVRGLGRVIARAATAAGVALAAFSFLRNLPLAMVLMTLVGGAVMLSAASANTILQTIVDDRMRGRIAAFYSMAFLGNLAAGALAAAFGAPLTLLVNGVACALAAAWFWRRLPALAELIRPTYRRLGIIPDDS
jgi:predicted MFS family arabinose efflux permease